jgi:HEAT repeat protein
LDISGNDKPELTCGIIQLLSANADPQIVPLLASFFSCTHTEIRKATIQALGRIGGPAAARIIAAFLNDPEEEHRILALDRIPGAAEKAPIERTAELISRRDFRKRSRNEKRAWLSFFLRSDPQRAYPILEKKIDSAGPFSGKHTLADGLAAVDVLAAARTQRASDILQKAARHGHSNLKKAGREALKNLGRERETARGGESSDV